MGEETHHGYYRSTEPLYLLTALSKTALRMSYYAATTDYGAIHNAISEYNALADITKESLRKDASVLPEECRDGVKSVVEWAGSEEFRGMSASLLKSMKNRVHDAGWNMYDDWKARQRREKASSAFLGVWSQLRDLLVGNGLVGEEEMKVKDWLAKDLDAALIPAGQE